ncbi:hypothetical protein GGF45_006296 [Coemansia sp. RSA 551]|nr:hypothetical protein GGF45_006296 [Coemansia sp. RSA 551]
MQASSNLGHAGDLESAIAKARDKLEKERIMLAKSRQIVSQMSNMNAKADAQIMVHDAEQRVSYLEAEYRRLVQKRDDKNSIKSGTWPFFCCTRKANHICTTCLINAYDFK